MTGRFAPSPTGALHLGNLRTALAAWLAARSTGSRFLVRIEDLDPDRCRAEHEAQQLHDLRTLGLDWDEPPIRQSSRSERYRQALAQLQAIGRAYPCWCTRSEIAAAASAPNSPGLGVGYPGTCRAIGAAERRRREAEQRPCAWRLEARAEVVTFDDALHATISEPVDDFVLWRSDGVAAYNLAVVLDDDDQGVQEVVRGDDLLHGTVRQILLARLLGLRALSYLHVPLVLSADGRRLAKRDGAVTLTERLALGDSPERILGWMAAGLGLLEWGEAVTPGQLIDRFTPQRLSRSATIFDPQRGLGDQSQANPAQVSRKDSRSSQ